MKNNVRKFREEQNITITDLADLCDIKYHVLMTIETKNVVPKLDVAYKIARILGKQIYHIWPNPYKVKTETVVIKRILKEDEPESEDEETLIQDSD